MSTGPSSLKSVALQGYTRSVEGENAGFEFVHKTIGEYLIGRGLLASLVDALAPLRTRASDSRCLEAAKKIGKIFSTGGLRSEISRFFEDEIRLRFNKEQSRAFIEVQLVPFVNWLLKNGLPVNMDGVTEAEPLTFAKAELLECRAFDAIWFSLQTLAKIAYPWHEYNPNASGSGWPPGVLKIDWPSPHSFVGLVTKIGARSFVSENLRFASFDFLDLRKQAVTDFTYGAVIYSSDEDGNTIKPEHWSAMSLRATNLDGAAFYHSNLTSADLTRASLKKARLNQVKLNSATLIEVDFQDASLWFADLSDARLERANLSRAGLYGALLDASDLTLANLSGARFTHEGFSRKSLSPAVFSGANLQRASFEGAVLGRTIFNCCDFTDTDFSNAKLGHITLLNTPLEKAITSGAELPKVGNKALILRQGEERPKEKGSIKSRRSSEEGLLTIIVMPIRD